MTSGRLLGSSFVFGLFGILGCSSRDIEVNQGSDSGAGPRPVDLPDCVADAGTPPGTGGPMMVPVGRPDGSCFWIDETEVSVTQYSEFLSSVPSAERSPCEWNTDYQPSDCESARPSSDHPVVCVDWCDARAYCEWVGKTLCPGNFVRIDDPIESSWYAACSLGGQRAYPYGDAYDPGSCNGAERPANGCPNACSSLPVGVATSCAVSGARDLSGNVAEWSDECRDGIGENDDCRVRGGSFTGEGRDLRCEAQVALKRSDHRADVGFRCCAE